ncbi:MAG TPA: metal-dependent hydrolase [Polyangiaceae bacterium]|nr:metal-dependent hydrolase [Polyangiaceae bacterium]
MDNVTHSLAAILVAEAVCENRKPAPDPARFRTAALWVSLIANNLPDLDFLYRKITPGKLGYLLHHRGYSHTFVVAPALAALAVVLVLGAARLRGVRFAARDVRALVGLAVFGSFLHIAMDFQNNYGVHPFWPFDDRWYYGDFLFIVEPLLWAFAVVVIASVARTMVASVGVVAVFAAALAYGMVAGAVPAREIVGLLFVAACVAVAARSTSRRGRVWLGVAGWLSVTGGFLLASRAALNAVTASAVRVFPEMRLVDVIRTPSMGNPVCWSVIALGTEGDRYVARRSVVSLAPSALPPRRCGARDPRAVTAPLGAIETVDGGVLWRSEFVAPLAELRALARTHCDAAAFLRYSRAPFWVDASGSVMGDLRFDRSRALDFAKVTLSESAACPPHVPPWTPPREDLLE